MIELAPIIIHTLEAFHDGAVIKNQKDSGRDWHRWDFAVWSVVYAVFAFYSCWFVVFGILSRLLVFSIVLNIIRGKTIDYLSNEGIDGWCKRNAGELPTLFFKLCLFVLALLAYAH